MTILTILRVLVVGVCVVLALLAVFRAPIGALWMPAVAATEGGYLLTVLAVPAFAGGVTTRFDQGLTAVGVVCVVLLLSPLARVVPVARELPTGLARAFGGLRPDTAATSSPFSFTRLFSFGSPDVRVETLVYAAPEGRQPLHLDLYGGPDPGKRRPLVVIIHGGSWSGGDKTQLPAMARRLASDGWAVASIDYRLAPAHRYPAAVDDVRAAVDFLRGQSDELDIDADSIVLYGRSAGAHLALLAAYRWHAPFVRGVVGLYAPSDLDWSWEHPTNPLVLDTPTTLGNFLGGPRDASEELRRTYTEASPYTWVDAESPPTLLVHGGRDELVFARQSDRLGAKLAAAHVPSFVLRLPWATHGCEASLAGPSGQLSEASVRYFLSVVAPARR